MPKWQISTYVSGNPSNWCHFIQIFARPPRTTNRITASPHAQAGFAIFSGSQLEWSLLLCCLLLRPRAWLPGCRDHQAGWPGLHGSDQREEADARRINGIFSLCVEVHISKGNEMVRPAPLGAHSHDGFLLYCGRVRCSETKQAFYTRPERFGRVKLSSGEKKKHLSKHIQPEHCVLTNGCECLLYGAYLKLCRNEHYMIDFIKLFIISSFCF